MTRWIVISFSGDYEKSNFGNVYAAIIQPVIREHRGTTGKCATDGGLTESEHAFPDLASARAAAKNIKAALNRLPSFLTGGYPVTATVMPPGYEKNGSHGIVRPDYSFDPSYRAATCKSFAATKKLAAKYKDRPSPPFPANDYRNARLPGNDGRMYLSAPNKKNAYSWKPTA